MSIQPVSHKSVFQNCIHSLAERLYQIASAIRSFVVGIFNAICCCKSVAAGHKSDMQCLAEHINAFILERMEIGILGFADIPGRFNKTTDGQLFPIVARKYDPHCPLIQKLNPVMTKLITQEFAKGEQSLREGFDLMLLNPSGQQLLPRDKEVDEKMQNIMKSFSLNSLSLHLHIKLDPQQTAKRKQPYFVVDEYMNGAKTANTSMTLSGARDAVSLGFVTTYR